MVAQSSINIRVISMNIGSRRAVK